MTYYASQADGIGGTIKEAPADFRVTEISGLDPEPLDADASAYPHVLVRVTLEGWETHEFVRQLSRKLGVSRHRISWAGTKDRHAITTQLMSLKQVAVTDIPSMNRATIDPIGRFGRSLTFGDLVGNAFEIRVHEPERPAQHAQVTEELQIFDDGDIGVPNYFGPQRFGSLRAVTHLVGLSIVEGDWEGAVRTYLTHSTPHEPAETRAFRSNLADHGDWAAGLEQCPSQLRYERVLLQALVDQREGENPYRDALAQFPESLQQLFVHAAQSYVFNQIISERLRRGHSLQDALVGDQICFGHHDDTLGNVPEPNRRQRVTEPRLEITNRHLANGRAWILAPLVGTETSLTDGEADEITADVLADHDLTPAAFDLPEPYGSTGAYRAMLLRTDLTVDAEPIVFRFGLPSGAYATVILREYLKGTGDPSKMADR